MGMVMFILGFKTYQQSQTLTLNGGKKTKVNIYFYLALFFFAIMCGLRYRCGADCESYAIHYLDFRFKHETGLPYFGRETEPLFMLFMKFMSLFGAGRFLFLGIIAFIEIAFFYSALKTRNYLLPYVGIVLILGPHFCSWNNGLRQVIASCIFIFALERYIDGEKAWKYLLWISVAYLIHKSSLMLVPFLFMKLYNVSPKKYISLILLLLSVFIGQTGAFSFAFNGIEDTLSFLEYDDYANKVDDIVEEEATIKSYGPRRITLLISYILIILFSEEMDAYLGYDQFYRLSFVFFMIYACSTEMLIGHTTLLTRPFLFFMPFLLICSAYLLLYLRNSQRVILLLVALVSLCTFSLISSVASYNKPNEEELYKFYFLQQNSNYF